LKIRGLGRRRTPGRPATTHRQAGFTLIEVVVAFVMLALVLSISFEVFTGGMRRAGDLEDYSRALTLAQSKLGAAGTEEQIKEGETQGDTEDGRYHWTLSARHTDEGAPEAGQTNNNPYQLFHVEVRVDWRAADTRERSIAMSTLVIGSRT
jgi:general secretion pathway protein I